MAVPILGLWSASSVLKQLVKKFPKIGPHVDKALSAGYLASSVLGKLFGTGSEFHTEAAEREKGRARTKTAATLGTLGLIGGLGAASFARKGISAAAQGAEAASILPPGGGPPPGPPAGPAAQPMEAQKVPPTPEQEAMRSRLGNVSEILPSKTEKDFPFIGNAVEKGLARGETPEQIYEGLQKNITTSSIIKRIEQQTGQPFIERINQMAGGGKPMSAEGAAPSLKKDDVAVTPLGAGEIHKVHGDNAYVEVDNKLRKVPLKELEKPPEDVIQAVNDILKIPEIDRSSNVALFVYDPEESKAMFQFHDGSMYKYLNIDPQVVQDIAAKNATPITTGQNAYGAWSPDDPHGSIGAALWAYVLKDPKYAKNRKGEPENPNYKKLETLYDYWKGLRKKKKKR